MGLVQQHVTLGALKSKHNSISGSSLPHLEAGRVPGEVRADPEDELILDQASAPRTGAAPVTCKQGNMRDGRDLYGIEKLALLKNLAILPGQEYLKD